MVGCASASTMPINGHSQRRRSTPTVNGADHRSISTVKINCHGHRSPPTSTCNDSDDSSTPAGRQRDYSVSGGRVPEWKGRGEHLDGGVSATRNSGTEGELLVKSHPRKKTRRPTTRDNSIGTRGGGWGVSDKVTSSYQLSDLILPARRNL